MECRTRDNASSCHGPQRFSKVFPPNFNKHGRQLVLWFTALCRVYKLGLSDHSDRSTTGRLGSFALALSVDLTTAPTHPCKMCPQQQAHLNLAATRSIAEVLRNHSNEFPLWRLLSGSADIHPKPRGLIEGAGRGLSFR